LEMESRLRYIKIKNMGKKAIEASLKAYPQKMQSIGSSWVDLNESDRIKYQAGYEQAETDARLDIAKYKAESWGDGYDEGYKTAKINLGWRSVIDAANTLIDCVERYVEPKPGQDFVHRSEILEKKNELKKLLK